MTGPGRFFGVKGHSSRRRVGLPAARSCPLPSVPEAAPGALPRPIEVVTSNKLGRITPNGKAHSSHKPNPGHTKQRQRVCGFRRARARRRTCEGGPRYPSTRHHQTAPADTDSRRATDGTRPAKSLRTHERTPGWLLKRALNAVPRGFRRGHRNRDQDKNVPQNMRPNSSHQGGVIPASAKPGISTAITGTLGPTLTAAKTVAAGSQDLSHRRIPYPQDPVLDA